MSRIEYINAHHELCNVPLLVDKIIENKQAYLNLLASVDKFHHKIIFFDTAVKVKKLYYFSPTSWSGVVPNHFSDKYKSIRELQSFPDRFAKNIRVIEMYRNTLIPLAKPVEVSNKIFIQRKSLSRMENENEVAELLQKHDYQLVNLENYSIFEQVYIFNNATKVVAEEGAGCVNLMYCKEKTNFLLITPSNWISYTFSSLAYSAGVTITYFLSSECNYNDRKHVVNVKSLEELIKTY